MIQQDPASARHMLVTTADLPIDVDDGFMHYSNNFCELGTWDRITADNVNALLVPLPDSPTHAEILQRK